MSVRAPNLFDSDTSQQQFQQIPEPVASLRKQQIVTFDTINTSDGEKRQLTKWEVQEKENRNSNYFTIETNHRRRGNSQTKQTTESQEYLLRQKCYQQNSKTQKQQPRKTNPNQTSIDNFKSSQMTKELLELDLPALISQITHKRRTAASFHASSQMYNSLTKQKYVLYEIARPQPQQKQGCIVKQQLGKQNSQSDILEAQQTRDRSITLVVRQPGKIVNQKQLKSNSIAIRK